MKKNYLKLITSFVVSLLVITGCQKQINEPQSSPATDLQKDESQARGDHEEHRNECRLTESVVDGEIETFHYNHKGLCDEWNISSWALLKLEYNASGLLTKSRVYVGNELIYTIRFFHTGEKVNKEIWYDGNSENVADVVFYTFNRRGQNTRMESFVGDYYTLNTFDAAGNVTAWDFYSGGTRAYSSRATFVHRFKNPRRAISGIDYGFPFLNAAIFANPFCIASEKLIAYDENGSPVVLYDYDPRRTSYRPASQDYPASGTFFDRVTNDWTSQAFDYENCGGRGHDNHNNSQKVAPSTVPGVNNMNLMMLLKPNSAKSMKERVNDFRQQLKNINNSGVNN